MDERSEKRLAELIRGQNSAALGTLRNGFPFVSMILFASSEDFTAYYIHISKLAHHTQDILKDPRVGLMISETDLGAKDPQTLARVSILGEAVEVLPGTAEFEAAAPLYLGKYPTAHGNFRLADFSLYRISVQTARYVADFGKIFNLKPADFRRAAGLE